MENIFEVRLHSVNQVKEFVALCNRQPFSITVGNTHRRVNAKSFMQLFTLDLSQPLTVCAECSEEEFSSYSRAVAAFR